MQQDKKLEEKAHEVCKEFDRLAGDRGTLEGHWNEIAERIAPEYRNTFSAFNTKGAEGQKNRELIFDSTASNALDKFAAILDSLLTPRNQTWHRLLPSDPYLMKDRATRLWFEETNRRLFKYRYSPKANFASQNFQNWQLLGAFGTGCVFIDKLFGPEKGLRYKAMGLGNCFFKENHQGLIDTNYRFFTLKPDQAIKMFGNKLPEQITKAIASEPNRDFRFIHKVAPNENMDPERVDYGGMEFSSCYIAYDFKHTIDEGGYTSFPYAISRYMQAVNEIYGRSPAMRILPSVKTLNEQKKTLLKQGHRAVDPRLLTHDDGVIDTFSLKSGHAIAGGVNADGRPLIHTLPVGNISVGKDMMDDERADIKDAFLVTLFQILVETPNMTATEVVERTREKGILLAPTVGRQQSEYLSPMIEREIDILVEERLLDPMPMAMLEARGDYRIEHDSPMSRAQRAEEAAGVMRTVEVALKVALEAQNPAVLDHFNWDEIMPELADIQGVPAKWMRSKEEIDLVRQSRAKEMETQQQIQAAPAAAAMVKAVGSVQKGKAG
jgi:hypothetical protein